MVQGNRSRVDSGSRFRSRFTLSTTSAPATARSTPAGTRSTAANSYRKARPRLSTTIPPPSTPFESKELFNKTRRVFVSRRKHFVPAARLKAIRTEPKQEIELPTEEATEPELSEEAEIKSITQTTEYTDLALALRTIQQAPIRPTLQTFTSPAKATIEFTKDYVTTPRTTTIFRTRVPAVRRTRITTTPSPIILTTRKIIRKQRPIVEPFAKKVTAYTYKPISDYNYYDDGETRLVGAIPEHSKVLIHSSGVIQCLDQGNFPHPVSCKKFISCAKMENGVVLGWEYTCPKNLSFDPIGGMCNWSAGLGCDE